MEPILESTENIEITEKIKKFWRFMSDNLHNVDMSSITLNKINGLDIEPEVAKLRSNKIFEEIKNLYWNIDESINLSVSSDIVELNEDISKKIIKNNSMSEKAKVVLLRYIIEIIAAKKENINLINQIYEISRDYFLPDNVMIVKFITPRAVKFEFEIGSIMFNDENVSYFFNVIKTDPIEIMPYIVVEEGSLKYLLSIENGIKTLTNNLRKYFILLIGEYAFFKYLKPMSIVDIKLYEIFPSMKDHIIKKISESFYNEFYSLIDVNHCSWCNLSSFHTIIRKNKLCPYCFDVSLRIE